MIRTLLISLCFLFLSNLLRGQGDFLLISDSLKIELERAESNQKRADIYKQLAVLHAQNKDINAREYLDKYKSYIRIGSGIEKVENNIFEAEILHELSEYELAIKILSECLRDSSLQKLRKPKARCIELLGASYNQQGNLSTGLEYLQRALIIYNQENQDEKVAELSNQIGIIYKNLGSYQQALSMYFEALDIFNELKNMRGVASSLMNIGIVFKHQKDFRNALNYYNEALSLYKTLDDQKGVSNCYTNIGVVYKNQEKYQKALNEYTKALKIQQENNFKRQSSYTYNNIGNIYQELGDCEQAMMFFEKSLSIKLELSDNLGISSTFSSMAECELEKGNSVKALEYLNKAIESAELTKSAETMMSVYETALSLAVKLNDFDLFKRTWSNYSILSDTLITLEKTKLIYDTQAKYEMQKEEALRKALEDQKNLQRELEEERKTEARIEKIAYIVGAALMFLLAITLFILFKSAKKSRMELEGKNEELRRTLLSKEEKEVLLKEIHHRVKNNMQIIMSLLRLQSRSLEDEKLQAFYQESQNRIKSMALVHEELYQTKDLTYVNVSSYLDKLLNNLILNYHLQTKVNLETEIKVETMGIDTLIPLGLILNEIISNSLKHAFTDGREGKIYVRIIQLTPELMELRIGDNGVGLDKGAFEKGSLGHELIDSLVEQIDGTYEIESLNGVHYTIRFKERNK